ncbi:MAG: hypothetical protein ACI957_004561, partial [Verrucomicrobiales bacterium]
MNTRTAFPLAILLAATALRAHGQTLRINEVVADNVTTSPDNADFDDYSDWIELHNPSNQSVDLDGFYLTDDPAQPFLWPVPSGATIPANGYLVIRADGFDAAPGETHVRDAAPWDRFTTEFYHTNFKLSASGETVGLYRAEGGSADQTVVSLGSTWSYLDTGADPGATWASPKFDDSAWPSGPAQLGYGEDDERTVIGYGPDDNAKYATSYFRQSFVVDDPSNAVIFAGRLLVDDGAIVYLNGKEVARIRMPQGTVTYKDFAADDASEGDYDLLTLSPSDLVSGSNTLAVEVHQGDDNSSDVSFDVELTTKGAAGPPVAVDTVTFSQQYPDISYGRTAADPNKWAFFGEPTAGAENTTIATLDTTASSKVSFELEGGFYSGTQSLALSTSSANANIHFTLDGSEPKSTSPTYNNAITVTETTVMRARTFESDQVPGPLATQTYFIDEPVRPLPVVSFVVEPDYFFGNTLGIYDNVYKGREAAINVAYYDENQDLGFQVNGGVKIGGENIWRFAQKPLNVKLSGKYGDDLISYKIFPTESEGTFDEVAFRNGGDNWPNAMLRDPIAPFIAKGQMAAEAAAYRPAVLYMNGAYWGIHNVRGRHGDQYFFNRYQINAGEYDLLVKEHTINGTELVTKNGAPDNYVALEELATSTDLSDTANYHAVADQIDLDSFIDNAAMIDFVYESSWHHNQEFWRAHRDGSKWRWTINDIDRGFNRRNVESSLVDDMLDRHPLFEAMMANTAFKHRFLQRYAAHMSSTFHPDRIADIVDQLATEVDSEIQRHIDRWKDEGGIESLSSRMDELDEIKQFAADRAEFAFEDTARLLEIDDLTADLTIALSSTEAGRVLINGVPMLPSYSATAKLYQSIAFDLTAEAAPGFVFTGWSTGDTASALSQTLSGNSVITATFAPSDETLIDSIISADTTLTTANSPYTSAGDIRVNEDVTLTIQLGVTVRMPAGASVYVHGALSVNGTEAAPVSFEARRESELWGALAFVNATGASTLSYLNVRGATIASNDPINLKSAISNYHSTIALDHADIDALFPVFARGGSTIVRASRIHPQVTGDGVNIKGGIGLVEDSTFVGNDATDTDAIDFDNVVDGVIRNNRIFAFRGFNSDAIDVGEGCVNLLVSENKIYNSSDKGISVGQASVAIIERNLIVGCTLGIGIKDTGSRAIIDQNTFALNNTAVAVFEKNLSKGGGEAVVTNSIIYGSKDAPVTVDALSSLTVSYTLSDSLPLVGTGNMVTDPLFNDPSNYDFALQSSSPAINAGDPAHAMDADNTRADIGALYTFDPKDYPYHVPNSVVINEILSHSHENAPDWIELFNSSATPVDISGWFVSDSKGDLEKYRIPEGTVIAANGYLVLYEDTTFGGASIDPNRLTPFALSENGETVYLYGPGDDLILEYIEEETFGPAPSGVSRGRYRKSTNTYNFVAMTEPSPGAANSAPLVGPIVISEIMYHPDNGASEYIELANISTEMVTLYDELKNEPWRFTNGITFDFPTDIPVTIAAGERILVTRDLATFETVFQVPAGTQFFQWADGGLSNSGESLELSSPGDIDAEGIRQWIRVDRVNYGDGELWPVGADGQGLSLTRLDESGYGNDVVNWTAEAPSPGVGNDDPAPEPQPEGYDAWAIENGLTAFSDDADDDGISNGLEYALGLAPK